VLVSGHPPRKENWENDMKSGLWSTVCLMAATVATALMPQGGQAEQTPVWGLQAYGDVCRVQFGQQQVRAGVWALTHLDRGCDIGNFAGYAMQNQNLVYFYDSYGQILASAEKQPSGEWIGVIGDGDILEMVYFGTQPAAPTHTPKASTGSSAAVGSCVTYYGSNTCAREEDLKYKSFSTIALQPLAPLNHRFIPDLNSRIQQVIPQNVCFQEVRNCTESLLNKEIWCQVEFGGQSGWILKKDKNHVYAMNGCG
jgi:hypothetical protein